MAKAGVKSIGGFVGRWNPSLTNLKSLLAAGTIGELIYAEADYWHPMRPSHHAWNLHSRKADRRRRHAPGRLPRAGRPPLADRR